MKRIISVFTVMVLLVSLSACGEDVSNNAISAATSSMDESVEIMQVGDYIIPYTWSEENDPDDAWGYMTSEAEIPGGSWDIIDGYLTCCQVDQRAGVSALIKASLDGEELCRVNFPTMEETENVSSALSFYCFGEEYLWLIEVTYRVVDEETGEVESTSELQKWSLDGQLQLSVPLGFIGEEYFVSDMALDANGDPILSVMGKFYFLDAQGQIAVETERVNSDYYFCRDKDGRLYLVDIFEDTIYTC